MSRIPSEIKQKDGFLIYTPPLSPMSSFSTPNYRFEDEKESADSSTFSRISPVLLPIIIILAFIFFISGLLHLLLRFLRKRPSSSPIYQSDGYPETSESHDIQRQLQQLFQLHDSGLDQSFIDALPVFYYKDIMGLKEPFDCSVCLSEFSDQDMLRLLPLCSHAFHINCIDTWLLSNSTCPLCRGALLSSGFPVENPMFNLDDSGKESNCFSIHGGDEPSCSQKPVILGGSVGENRVFSVRLGKFRSMNDVEESGEREQEESSMSNLDARRCYSMGTFQYVVGDSSLLVALSHDTGSGGSGSDVKAVKVRGENGCFCW